jgi:competence protein ComEA
MTPALTRVLAYALFALLAVPFNGNAQAQAQPLPDGPGKEAVQQACTKCHLLRSVVAARHTRQEWDNIVTDMIGRGAALTAPEITPIVEYLSKAFPKDTSFININRAASRELVDALRLTPQESDALIRYREENGYFNKFQDLEKVTGLDLRKLESAKARLQF